MNQFAGHIHKIHIWREAMLMYTQMRKRQSLQTGVRVLLNRYCFIQQGRKIPYHLFIKIFSISSLIYPQRTTRIWRILAHTQTGNLVSLVALSLSHHNSTCKFQCKSIRSTLRLCFAEPDFERNVHPLPLPSTFKMSKKPMSIAY